MQFLAKVLDDPTPHLCGKCSVCLGCPMLPEEFPHELGVKAAQFLHHSEFLLECKK
ncbi:hypothetical protein [Xanthomonas arboricola]